VNQIEIPQKLTKAAIQEAGRSFALDLLDAGEKSPLDALLQLRALRDAIDVAVDEIQDAAMDEAQAYGRDDSVRFGVRFQVRGGSTRYTYDHDSVWAEMKASETAVADQRKAREKFLQALSQEMVDPITGEFVSPAVVTGVGTPTLALTFPKE
jgi:hypothetical protein